MKLLDFSSWPVDPLGLLVLVVILISAATVGLLARGIIGAGREHRVTFRRVATQMGLDRRKSRLLARTARRAGLSSPLAMLVSRGCFDRAAGRLRSGTQDASEMKDVRRSIFGGD